MQRALVFLLTTLLFATHRASAADSTPSPRGRVFDVRDYGAAGNGVTLDTAAINAAVDACGQAGGGQVRIPPGRYLSGTVQLRSHVTLFLEAGATLVGTTNLAEYRQPTVPAYLPEARWGKWHRALVLGENLEGVAIAGPGVIDGNKVFDPTGEERMRGPHGVLFVNCRGFTLHDISIVDAANYAVYFEVSDDVDVRNVTITGGWDGVHFRGAPGHDCHNVNITNCRFYTGDDSIAGRYWDNTVINDCIINSSCNGIRLIGPATHLVISHCLFYGPGVRPHRTSGPANRRNMLSGINLQPGAWDRTQGLLDDVLIANNSMRDVASPLTFWSRPGNVVGRITVDGLRATGVYRSALCIESWADPPMSNVVLRDVNVEFTGGGTAAQAGQAIKGPGVDARALPVWGLYTRNVDQLTLQSVRLNLAADDMRPAIRLDGVARVDLDDFKFTRVAGVAEPFVTNNVGNLRVRSVRD